MAIIKCKMCGGDLEITEGLTVCECEYCGTKQTVPNVDDEKKLTLFNRAGRLLRGCEFDKAAGVFESIVADFPEESEAYWGLVLCKYGIEYVDDPATGRKVPTCHRSGFDSVMKDSDFEQACENADSVARRQYREEAKAIEELRRGIIEVSGKEEPYDIFICYKETDENGGRTIDSVLAQDVYDALTAKGYRVFFSRITLEDKLGQEYEPYIFAALNSAKVMLAFGTDYDYYNAVWVKNEWSRFLKLMSKDKSKHLIPCYKGIDAYDMPEEFARLQAQDMGKVGAVQDLLRGIEKLLPRKMEEAQPVMQQVVQSGGPNVASLLDRGNMALEDGEWDKAKEYYDHVLNMDARCAEAYVGIAMAEGKCRDKEAFAMAYATPNKELDQNRNVVRAKQFGDVALKAWFAGLDTKLQTAREAERIERKRIAEEERLAREKKAEEERIAREKKAEEERIARKRLSSVRERIQTYRGRVAAGEIHTVGLRSDGTVVAVGSNDDGRCNVSNWQDIVAITADAFHTVGLQSDGTVVAVGGNKDGQCNVSDWQDIVAITADAYHTVGLRSDGTVVAVGRNKDGQCNVSDWQDIVAITADNYHTVGLQSDGRVVAVGKNDYGQCNVSNWKNIVAITAGVFHTVGLQSDGRVVAVGRNDDGRSKVSNWQDIVAITADAFHTVGLKSDGRVVAVGRNDYGQCNVSDWKDIVAITAGYSYTLGLQSDGRVVAVGRNDYGQCDVSNWKNIVAITAGYSHTLGLQSDGRVVAVGSNNAGQCSVSSWKLFKSEQEKEADYVAACAARESADTEEKLEAATALFNALSGYKDSTERAEACQKEREALRNARVKSELTDEKEKLTAELPNVKGLFVGPKKARMEARIAEIEAELAKLR